MNGRFPGFACLRSASQIVAERSCLPPNVGPRARARSGITDLSGVSYTVP